MRNVMMILLLATTACGPTRQQALANLVTTVYADCQAHCAARRDACGPPPACTVAPCPPADLFTSIARTECLASTQHCDEGCLDEARMVYTWQPPVVAPVDTGPGIDWGQVARDSEQTLNFQRQQQQLQGIQMQLQQMHR